MAESINLSLGAGDKSGAWDDRELVQAYDAALEEFHVHHPGEGSWLDKVTAASMQGQPVLGAKTYGTNKPKKRAEPEQEPNPYTVQRHYSPASSPKYAPPSPSPSSPPAPALAPQGIMSASVTTYDEAIGYAMAAQYAAGYWLGVAHTKASAKPPVESNIIQTEFIAEKNKLKR